MKIPLSFGFVLILLVIAFVTIGSLSGNQSFDTFSIGFLVGEMLIAGIFMINHGFTYDTKKRRFEEW